MQHEVYYAYTPVTIVRMM